ncbi:MAG TPA: hypothetical protein VGI21_24100, partial [Streptosporangiaceae bacterium]
KWGMPLIIICRFIPGGRTAITLCCGLVGYSRRRFVAATAVAAVVWALYSFFLGRLGGKAFENNVWAGLILSLGISLVIAAAVEAGRRISKARSRRRDAGQVEPDHPGQHQADRHQLERGHCVAEE